MVDDGAVVGRVAELWRFPVESMLGERLDEVEVAGAGVVGDRGWAMVDAMVDASDGKVVSPENPRKWPRVLELRARCLQAPAADSPPPPAQIAFPDSGSGRRSAGVDGDACSPGTIHVGDPVLLHP